MKYLGAIILLFTIFSFAISISAPAHAICADPVEEKGSIVFNDTYSTMMFCDGTVWWDMKAGTGGVWFRSSNSDISYTGGNVGVGTDAPLSALHVAGSLLLDNSGSCDGGGVNKGALRLNAAADALEICDGSGTWLPLTSESSGGGGAGSGSGDTLLTDWPDAIKCADSAIDLVLYLRNFDGNRVAYAPPQVDANPQYILYDKATADYFSHSNMAGFDCVENGWSVANLESASRTFSLVSSGVGVANPAECVDGVNPEWSGTEQALVCPTAVIASGGFDFPDSTHVQGASTLVTSDILEIDLAEDPPVDTGFVSISGEGNPEYRVCADSTCSGDPAFTVADGTIQDNEFLQLRLTATDVDGASNTATVTVADLSDSWTVATVSAIQMTISADTFDYNLFTEAQNAGWVDGQAVELTINSGVSVGSSSTANAAFNTGAFPAGTQITIINNGRIYGAGGYGGDGGDALPGSDGGAAINAQSTLVIDNTNGEIWGGGGGGPGGDGRVEKCWGDVPTQYWPGAAGGGGAGSTPGQGGSGPNTPAGCGYWAPDGDDGTTLAGGGQNGACCALADLPAGPGGNPGEDGGDCPEPYACGTIGKAGSSVVTNGNNVTWIAIGDRRGPVQ